MRGLKSFLVLLVIALGLGAYIYFVEAGREIGPTVDSGEPVFTIEAGTIDQVEVRSSSGETTTVRKDGADWQIVAPAPMPADVSAVSALVSSIEGLQSDRVVDEAPASVVEYGLDPARLSLTFRVAGDAAPRRLDIGDRTPTGADLYARVEGDPRLLLIASYLETSFDKTAFDLRDKRILAFSRDGVDRVQLDPAEGGRVVVTKAGDDWRLAEPLDARADPSGVDSLISRVFNARMTSVVYPDDPASTDEPSAADLRRFGLDRPVVTVTMGEGSTRAALAVGAESESGGRYARDLSRPIVFTVESAVHDDVAKTADDLRAKDVFRFRTFTAVGVDLSLGETRRTYEKQTTTSDEDPPTTTEAWVETAPGGGTFEESTLASLLSTISNLRADSFVARAPASGEDFIVTARYGDAASPDEERVILRRDGDTVLAIRDDEPGAAVVPTADVDRALDLFRQLTESQ